MTMLKRLLVAAAAAFMIPILHAEEEVPVALVEIEAVADVEKCDCVDDAGWYIVVTDEYTVHFPTEPKVDKKGGTTTYGALDSSTFPVVMYSFSVNTSKAPIDAEQYVNSTLERLSTYPSNLFFHELTDSEDEIVLDTLCSDAKTRIMRCERIILAKDKIYTLTTMFFPNSAENHEYFIQNFVKL